jgi:hypothetical protein
MARSVVARMKSGEIPGSGPGFRGADPNTKPALSVAFATMDRPLACPTKNPSSLGGAADPAAHG